MGVYSEAIATLTNEVRGLLDTFRQKITDWTSKMDTYLVVCDIIVDTKEELDLMTGLNVGTKVKVREDQKVYKISDTGNGVDATETDIVPKSGDFCYLEGPESWDSPYITNFGGDKKSYSKSMTPETQGIRINESGYYRIEGEQRMGVYNDDHESNYAYVGISLNGSRSTLETKSGALWFHNHAAERQHTAKSIYIGWLDKGDLVCFGAPSETSRDKMYFSTQGYAGFLLGEKLGGES